MTWQEALSRCCCGAVLVLVAHAWFGAVAAQQPEDAVDVCIDEGGEMRLIDSDGTCGGGERQVRLKHPQVERPCEAANLAAVETLARRVAELESRGDERILDRTAIAPFEVVNEAGTPMFSVTPPDAGNPIAGANVFNETGARVANIAMNLEGGSVNVHSGAVRPYLPPSGDPIDVSAVSATLSAFGEYLGVTVYTQSDIRLTLGRRSTGRYGLEVFGKSGKAVAGFGESQAGSGLAMVFDATGLPRAAVNVESATGSGIASVVDAAGQVVTALRANGSGGSGLLQLRNNADVVMVEAGTLDTGIGVVRAGPGAFQHGLGFLGLPASYIEGKK